MADENKSLPMSSAGIVASTEEADTGIKLKPEHVTAMIVALTLLELLLPMALG
ncbi:MAG: hypothetical protein HY516_00210 [Candidatus Aenigmarchaeota archaeon]|nr:hypothetical protein [Candidatus Aenigmarchaeota archaeon]